MMNVREKKEIELKMEYNLENEEIKKKKFRKK